METEIINEVNIRHLEYRMARADWAHDFRDDIRVRNNGYTEIQYLKSLLEAVSKDPAGKRIANSLWDKHVPHMYSRPSFMITETNKNNIIMTEKELKSIEKQFLIAGFKEAFTPELIEQLKKGVKEVQHPHYTMNEGDAVKAILHVKKDNNSFQYYFNKFDAGVIKEGQEKEVSQTFYLTDKNKQTNTEDSTQHKQADKFTLKKAANYLAGRPVHGYWTDKEGKEYEAWVKMNIKANGETEIKRYTNSYPFDINQTVRQYALKETATPEYEGRLIESYKRGNLQKATFVGTDGKEEQLYTAVRIGLVKGGSLDVYGLDKKEIPVEKLMEKNYITKELGQNIIDRVKEIQSLKNEPDSTSNKLSPAEESQQRFSQKNRIS